MARESGFESRLIEELRRRYPGAVLLKNDPRHLQGIPDRLILYGPSWAAFEVKAHKTAPCRPNQKYYVDVLNEMSYASFVYPENEEVFLDEIHRALRKSWRTRVP